LTEHAELSGDIDVEAARAELEKYQGADEDDEEAKAAVRRAEARIKAAGRAS
jgi:F-type H+-transporting ATPase subunit epsilon